MPRERKGSIVKRKDRPGLWARVSYQDETGRQRVIQRKVANRTEGKALLKQLLREIEDDGARVFDGERMNFQKLADVYTDHKLQPPVYNGETRVSGMRSWKHQLVALKPLVEYFGKMRIRSITHASVEKYKTQRLQTKTRRGDDRNIASVNRELSLLRAMLNYAKRQGWLNRNPFGMGESIISNADETRRERILTREEEARLLTVCAGPRAHLRPMLICALDSAMRRGELFKLRWSDIDLMGGIIRVRKTTTKTWEARSIGMTTRLQEELRRLWEVAPPDPDGLVFGIRNNIKRSFGTACKLAQIEDFRLHDCRHTATTRMIQAGMAPMEVMKITGHKQIDTFLRYMNTNEQTARRAAEALDVFYAEDSEATKSEMVN
ncbi:MAG: tyrosine-type recombinase/integrase [Blastocatellia bacterium]